MRKGMMVGKGKKGYHNVIGKDPIVHSMSAKGIKQPQRTPHYLTDSGESKMKISNTHHKTKTGQIKKNPLKKAQQRRWIGSICYQFGTIKSRNASEKLFNKTLEELDREEFQKLFEYMRGHQNG